MVKSGVMWSGVVWCGVQVRCGVEWGDGLSDPQL